MAIAAFCSSDVSGAFEHSLGSSLWNLFFEDARFALEILSFVVMVYADDLNAYKSFAKDVENSDVLKNIDESQAELHKGG